MPATLRRFVSALSFLCCCALGAAASGQTFDSPMARRDVLEYQILPSDADPAVTRFNETNIVLFNRAAGPQAPLVVFLPGTGGAPKFTEFLSHVVADLGYNVIGLEYNSLPFGNQVCWKVTDPECLAKFREKRTFGTNVTDLIDDKPEESIRTRLVKLLQYLDSHHPEQGWSAYLRDGEPRWDRLVVSGLSQGAGMAAYIAKLKRVERVVLFSSPWDTVQATKPPAPWLYHETKTPLEHWFAEYHARENTVDLIVPAYKALAIPENHILVFNLDMPPGRNGGDNPFHGSTAHLRGYIPRWRFMFGHPCPGPDHEEILQHACSF